MTTRAHTQRVSFSFSIEDDANNKKESESLVDRQQLKREVAKSLSAAEERK